MADPDIVEGGGFTVVGLHYAGRNQAGEIASLWERVNDRWPDLEPIATDGNAYGVSYGGDPDTGEFEYLAGVRADLGTEPPEGFEAIDVPEATVAVFRTTLAGIEETMRHVHGEWLPASEYDLAMGPEVEVYEAGFDPGDPSASFAVQVPIEPAN